MGASPFISGIKNITVYLKYTFFVFSSHQFEVEHQNAGQSEYMLFITKNQR